VSLVLKAGGVGEGGELYLLDMGKPISIKELAEQMIRFYGYEPEKEIKISYTGLRPGEKLIERLWSEEDSPEETAYTKILKLKRARAINGRLNSVLELLKPICFADHDKNTVYRNRRELRKTLRLVIPSLNIPEDEPEY